MWLVNYRNLLIRAVVLVVTCSGCGALRVAIPKDAQVFRDKIVSDALSYSYSAMEFGASNETQFKTWSLVKNLQPQSGSSSSSHQKDSSKSAVFGVEANRRPTQAPRNTKKLKTPQLTKWSSPATDNFRQGKKNSHPFVGSPAAVSPFPITVIRSSIDASLVSDIYPTQFGFHPLLFATSPNYSPFGRFEFRSSTPRAPVPSTLRHEVNNSQGRVVLSSGISVLGGGSGSGGFGSQEKKPFKQGSRLKKGRKSRNRFNKGKVRPVGLDQFNTAVQQAALIGSTTAQTTTQNPFPNLSPGYSRVTQNLPNVVPAVIYGTTNHLDADQPKGNNSWIPIVGPGVRAGSSVVSNGGGGVGKKVTLTRVLKSKSRPKHRFSSNYSLSVDGSGSSGSDGQSLKVRSHRLAGILSQSQRALLGGAGNDVVAVYPNNKNYSTVTAKSRAKAVATTYTTGQGTEATTPPTAAAETTTESDIIHARITKIPNRSRPSVDIVLNVTTQFPIEIDDKVRARLKAIRKIVRRLP